MLKNIKNINKTNKRAHTRAHARKRTRAHARAHKYIYILVLSVFIIINKRTANNGGVCLVEN